MSAASDKSALLTSAATVGITNDEWNALRAALAVVAPFAWKYYELFKGKVLFSKRVLFWAITVTIADLRPFVVLVFGEEPAANA